MCANNESVDETARMLMIARPYAICICDMYHFIMCQLIYSDSVPFLDSLTFGRFSWYCNVSPNCMDLKTNRNSHIFNLIKKQEIIGMYKHFTTNEITQYCITFQPQWFQRTQCSVSIWFYTTCVLSEFIYTKFKFCSILIRYFPYNTGWGALIVPKIHFLGFAVIHWTLNKIRRDITTFNDLLQVYLNTNLLTTYIYSLTSGKQLEGLLSRK